MRQYPMRPRFALWATIFVAAIFVGVGAFQAFTGWHRQSAQMLLVIGLTLAAVTLLLDGS